VKHAFPVKDFANFNPVTPTDQLLVLPTLGAYGVTGIKQRAVCVYHVGADPSAILLGAFNFTAGTDDCAKGRVKAHLKQLVF
jgi:hypothetical protein